ncbi:MAG: hypothetical protein Q9217_003587 [Psora testacea]
MPVQPLSHMARRACIKNIRQITDVGDTPYEVVRPVLLRIENPEHLRQIEERSPQICGADAEIWRELIKRDIPNWGTKAHEPKNPSNYYKVYRKLLKESKKEVDQDAQLLKATLDGIKSKQAQNTAKQVELNVVKLPNGIKPSGDVIKLPRNSKFFVKEQNTKDIKPEYTQWERKHGPIEGAFLHPKLKGGDTTKATPKTKMAQFRKEAVAMSRFPRKDHPGIISAKEMKTKPSIAKVAAPPTLLQEYQKPAAPKPIDPTIQPAGAFNPRKRRIEHVESPEAAESLEQREQRLRALTTPLSDAKPSTSVSSFIRPPRIHRPPSDWTFSNADAEKKAPSPPTTYPESNTSLSTPSRQSASCDLAPSSPECSAKTSSPNGNIPRPTARLKAKAPVNPFMPVKRQRVF